MRMAADSTDFQTVPVKGAIRVSGVVWLVLALVGATVFFWDGILTLIDAWQVPEYSHGPLIPVLSGLLFLRQLKTVPIQAGPISDRGMGLALILFSLILALIGKLANIGDIVAYALILWIGGLLLLSFGWRTGKHFWPPVLHLVYMLPLPGLLYYKFSTTLQVISSEFGVYLLRLMAVPVFLDGNIIDLGVYKLHVAEACSGLRYLFPILSFSYIFAVLYRGPMWHKAVLLISAAPITVVMNSVRIGIVGYIVNRSGIEHAEGISHLLEGWVIFITCVLILFALAWILLKTRRTQMSLIDALDLDTDGLWPQAKRVLLVQPSTALITAVVVGALGAGAWLAAPRPEPLSIERQSFVQFPRVLGAWQAGAPVALGERIERALGADDSLSIAYRRQDGEPGVDLFMAWYPDQSQNGIHSPEVCIPATGWEMANIEQVDMSGELGLDHAFKLNRAIIQKGVNRLMVYYWFEQHGRRIAWDYEAKFNLIWDGVLYQRNDGALIRMITPIQEGEEDHVAEARLTDMLGELVGPLDRFVPPDPRIREPVQQRF